MFKASIRRATRAFSLIEILVVTVIIILLAAFLLPNYLGGKTKDGKEIHTPYTAAKDTVCRTNLTSVRQSIEAARSTDPDGKAIQNLSDLRELTPDLLHCPVGGEAYIYDPQSGKVHCPHPGHESY